MDEVSIANWQTIKDKMEESGNIENMFYRRACAIVAGNPDPLEQPKLDKEE